MQVGRTKVLRALRTNGAFHNLHSVALRNCAVVAQRADRASRMGARVLGEKDCSDFASRASDEDHLPSATAISCRRCRGAQVAVGALEMTLQLADPTGCTSSRGRKAIATHC